MELGAFSFDVDARITYLVLLFAGMLAAFREVRVRLKALPGIWQSWRTQILFVFFWATPIVLFFMFDHTGALNDTSPIAALLIAFGYQQLLSRGSTETNTSGLPTAPPQIGGLWEKILGDTNKLQERAQDDVFHRQFEYNQATRRLIVSDPARYDALRALVRRLTAEPAKLAELDAKLVEFDKAFQNDAPLLAWRKADHLLDSLEVAAFQLKVSVRVHALLLEEKVIDKQTSDLYPGDGASDLWQRAIAVVIPVVLASLLTFASFADWWRLGERWYEWRLAKPHVSNTDLEKTREALLRILDEPSRRADEVPRLAALIRGGSLAPARVETVVAVLTDGTRNDAAARGLVWKELVASLRVSNIDGRARVNSGLVYLADKRVEELKAAGQDVARLVALLDELRKWKPSDIDSLPALARRIDEWEAFHRVAWP